MVETNSDVQEAEELEDLPVLRPEEEDAEITEKMNGGESEENGDNEVFWIQAHIHINTVF